MSDYELIMCQKKANRSFQDQASDRSLPKLLIGTMFILDPMFAFASEIRRYPQRIPSESNEEMQRRRLGVKDKLKKLFTPSKEMGFGAVAGATAGTFVGSLLAVTGAMDGPNGKDSKGKSIGKVAGIATISALAGAGFGKLYEMEKQKKKLNKAVQLPSEGAVSLRMAEMLKQGADPDPCDPSMPEMPC